MGENKGYHIKGVRRKLDIRHERANISFMMEFFRKKNIIYQN